MKLRWAVPLVFLMVLALCLSGMAQNYAPATNYPTSAAPQGLARGDFNEDGKPDIAVTDFNAATIQIFPGNGDGTFASPIATSVAPHPYSLAAADLDGDGHLDLVISLLNAQGFEVLLGNGNGQFHSPVIYTVSGLPTTSTVGQAVLKDINGDGKIDVVIATDRGISVFLNNGSGGFTQSSIPVDPGNVIANVAILDLNGDRIPDLVATESTFDVNGNPTGTVVYALGHGDGTFGTITNIADLSGPPTGLAIADFDHDGLPDIVVSFAASTIGTGGGVGIVGCHIRICLPQDGGGGGTTTVPGGIGFIRQTSALQFAAANSIGTDKNPGFLIAGDFDGDGRLDVAEASTALAQILVYRGNGDGTFAAALPLIIPSIAGEIATESFGGTVAQDLFASANSANQVSVFVNQGANTLSLASSLNPAGVSQSVTLTATVQPKFASAGTLSGSVIVADGQTTLGTATVNPSGVATLPVTFTTAGDHQLTAVYGGNSSFVGGSSASLVEKIAIAPSVTLSSSINPSSVGQVVHFTVAVAGSASGPIPSGTVTLFANGAPVLSATVDSGGLAILTTSSLPLGTNDVLAQYSGDSNYPGADSPHLSQVVNKSNSTATLTSSVNPSTFGQTINFTVSVVPFSGTGTPTGNVTLKDAGTAIATTAVDATGSAVIAVSNLSVGTHSLTADYAGDANFNASSSAVLSQVVNATSTSVVLTDSPNPSTSGQAVVLHALVKATAGTATPSGSVVFSEGATVLGAANLDATGTASLSVSSLAIGSHNLTASFAGNASFQGSTSAAVVQVVNKNNSTATLTSSANPSSFGQTINFTVSVTAPFNGAGTPTGNVTLKDAGTAIATAALDATGAAVIGVSNLSAGTHTLTVDYAGDANFNASSSASLSQAVNATSTSVVITGSPNPSTSGQAVVLHAVVKVATGSAIPSGTIAFSDGATVLGSTSLDATGAASFTVTSLAVGSHNLTASYAGNTTFQSSTSAAMVQVVNPTSTSALLTSSPNPSTTGQAVVLHAVVKAATGTVIPSGSVAFSDGATVLGSVNLDATGAASLTVTSFAIGSHSLTASYAGNASFQGSTSTALVQVVSTSSTSVAFNTSPNPSTLGQAVALTAVVKAATGGTPSGVVVFNEGTSVLGSANLDATGTAVLTLASFAVGSHNLTATYAGNVNFQGSASAVVTQVVNRSAVQITMSSSANPAVYGQSVTLQIAVTSAVAGNTRVPTGNISFTDGTAIMGQVLLDATGHAVLTASNLNASTHTISATYAGDTNFLGASASLSQVINKAASATSLSSSLNPATNASTLTVHAVVTSAAGTPSGTVQFFDGAAVVGTAVLDNTGSASMSFSNLAVGSHSLSATFTGSSNLTSSASSAVTEAVVDSHSLVSLVSSANPQTSSQPVVFTALVTPALNGQPVSGTITFRDGTQILASIPVSNGGANLSITQLAVGTHSIVASYQASTTPGPFDGISAPVAQVIQSSLAPDYSVSIQPAKGSVLQGGTFTTAIAVTPANGFTGSVTLGCAGLPANASCAFFPAQIAINGQAPATSRLQIVTAPYISANHVAPVLAKANWGRMMALWFAPGVFGCVFFQNRKRLRMGIVVVCVLACGLLIAGCGSSSSSRSNQTRQAHTYNVTVTASSGTVVHSTILQLTLQ